MKRPFIIMLVCGVLLGGIGGGAYLYFIRTKEAQLSQPLLGTPTPTPMVTHIDWDDPAGFTIKYPDILVMNKHDEDNDNYAHLEFTHPAHSGSLVVFVKDLPRGVVDTVSWGKKAATPSSAISFDTTLSGMPAQKILISSPVKTVSTGIVYDGVLWYIEAAFSDDSFWQSIYDGMVNTFVIKPVVGSKPDGNNTVPAQSADVAGYDEEEVLE